MSKKVKDCKWRVGFVERVSVDAETPPILCSELRVYLGEIIVSASNLREAVIKAFAAAEEYWMERSIVISYVECLDELNIDLTKVEEKEGEVKE